MRPGPALAAVALVLCSAAGTPSASELPYRLQVSVTYGYPTGPESLRDDLERELVAELGAARCFRTVQQRLAGPSRDDDLELRVTIGEFREETEHDLSIGERSSPGSGPGAEQRMVARIVALYQVEVITLAESSLVREKRFRQGASWRPLYTEDPRHRAREEMIDEVVRRVRSFLCKGSPGKWVKQLEQARGAGPAEPR